MSNDDTTEGFDPEPPPPAPVGEPVDEAGSTPRPFESADDQPPPATATEPMAAPPAEPPPDPVVEPAATAAAAPRARSGRPVLGAIAGFFLGFFVWLDLVLLDVIALESVTFWFFPPLGLALGIALAKWAPFGRKQPSPT